MANSATDTRLDCARLFRRHRVCLVSLPPFAFPRTRRQSCWSFQRSRRAISLFSDGQLIARVGICRRGRLHTVIGAARVFALFPSTPVQAQKKSLLHFVSGRTSPSLPLAIAFLAVQPTPARRMRCCMSSPPSRRTTSCPSEASTPSISLSLSLARLPFFSFG